MNGKNKWGRMVLPLKETFEELIILEIEEIQIFRSFVILFHCPRLEK